jgi:hypothetical protein
MIVGIASPRDVVGVLDWQPIKGVTRVDDCGLSEIENSKERHVAHNLDRFWPQCA